MGFDKEMIPMSGEDEQDFLEDEVVEDFGFGSIGSHSNRAPGAIIFGPAQIDLRRMRRHS